MQPMLDTQALLINILETEQSQEEMLQIIAAATTENLNKTNSNNETALHITVSKNNLALVKALLEREKIQTDVQSFFYGTPLTYAIFLKHFEIAEQLIVREKDCSNTKHPGALYWAVSGNNKNLVKLLIDKGAKASAPKYEGYQGPPEWAFRIMPDATPFPYGESDFSALLIGIDKDNTEMVEFLLELGVDNINKLFNKTNALSLAAEKRNKQIVQLLLKNGADLDIQLEENLTVRQFILNDFNIPNEIKNLCKQEQQHSQQKEETFKIFVHGKFFETTPKNLFVQHLKSELENTLEALLTLDPKSITEILINKKEELIHAGIQITINTPPTLAHGKKG